MRPYQLAAVQNIREQFPTSKRVILCLPTGAGKTIVFSHIAESAAAKGKRVLILTHRRELKKQAAKTSGARIEMVETYFNAMKRGEANPNTDADLLIIDECHIGNFRKVLEGFTGCLLYTSDAADE